MGRFLCISPWFVFPSVSVSGLKIGHQSMVISVLQWFSSVQPGSDWKYSEGRMDGRKEGGRPVAANSCYELQRELQGVSGGRANVAGPAWDRGHTHTE